MAWRCSGKSMAMLVENMQRQGMILDDRIADAFRAADRALFLPESKQDEAYTDCPVLEGSVHQSAPHMYAEIVRFLELEPGCSFLNVGSGTGFLSTVVGLLIEDGSTTAVNHGVELDQSNVELARNSVTAFLDTNTRPFAIPSFFHGNALHLDPASNLRYKRIYVGAACRADLLHVFTALLAPGGRLVAPVGPELICVTKSAEDESLHREVMAGVMFASLREIPAGPPPATLSLVAEKVPSLQSICRDSVRVRLNLRTHEALADCLLPAHVKSLLIYGDAVHRQDDKIPEAADTEGIPFEEALRVVEILKRVANEYIAQRRFVMAVRTFRKALGYISIMDRLAQAGSRETETTAYQRAHVLLGLMRALMRTRPIPSAEIQKLAEEVNTSPVDIELRVAALLLAAETVSLSEDASIARVERAYKRVLELDPGNEAANIGADRFRANTYQEQARDHFLQLFGLTGHEIANALNFPLAHGSEDTSEEEEEEEEEEEGEEGGADT